MTKVKLKSEEERFLEFVKDITKASQKHGIVIGVTGNVMYLDKEDFEEGRNKKIEYTKDCSSGDIHAYYNKIWE